MTPEDLKEKLFDKKQPVSFRVRPKLVEDIDAILDQTSFRSRNEFVEEAVVMYLEFVEDKLQS